MTHNQENDSVLAEYVDAFNPDPKHFEMMPHILSHLTYIELDGQTGIYYRKRLKAAHKEVYRIIKMIAGTGICFRTEEYIANMAGCSVETVSEAKWIFTEAFEQLDGNPLMTITQKSVMTKRKNELNEERIINKRPVHVCQLMQIWKYNNAYMTTLMDKEPGPMKQPLSEKEAELVIEKMFQKSSAELASQIVHNLGADPKKRESPGADPKKRESPSERADPKKRVDIKQRQTPLLKDKDTMAKAIQMSLINSVCEEDLKSECSTHEWLQKMGFKQAKATQLLSDYGIYQIQSAVFYVKKELKNKPPTRTISGYLLQAIEKSWWVPKTQ